MENNNLERELREREGGTERERERSRILIIGGTGKIGQWISRASIALHYPTFLLVRPATLAARPDLVHSLTLRGATVLQGCLEDKNSLLEAIQRVDIVISAVHGPQLLAQLNIVEAIQQAGCTQRFLPSEFGIDVNGEGAKSTLDFVGEMFKKKRRVRQAIEAAGISFSYVCSFCFAEYFAKTLGQPPDQQQTSPPMDKVIIYGDGHTKVSFLCEEDIGFVTVKVANDPRALNKIVHLRFPENILSQLELVTLWEQKIGKMLEKIYFAKEDMEEKFQVSGPLPWEDIRLIMKHAIFIRGLTSILERGKNHLEACELYPLEKYTTMDEYFGNLSGENLLNQND